MYERKDIFEAKVKSANLEELLIMKADIFECSICAKLAHNHFEERWWGFPLEERVKRDKAYYKLVDYINSRFEIVDAEIKLKTPRTNRTYRK